MDVQEYLNFWFSNLIHKKKLSTIKEKSVFEIDYNKLKKNKIKLLIFDIDDTLTSHKDEFSEDILTLLKKISKEFKIAILSNASEERWDYIETKLKPCKVYVERSSLKPSNEGTENILKKTKTKANEAAMIGDKISMDMWSAYVSKIKERILVKPYSYINNGKEAIFIQRFIRDIENWYFN